MATDRHMIDRYVYLWYVQEKRWVPQNKSAEWPDRVLCDQGVLFFNADVLNLGCFYPEDEEAFAHEAHSWTAIDFIPDVIERCRRHQVWSAHVRFDVGDMRELAYADNTFDVVTDFSAGDQLTEEDWQVCVKEAYRVLRPGGHFLTCFSNHAAFVHLLGESWRKEPAQVGDYGYVRTATVEGTAALLEAAGFKIVRVSHDNNKQLRCGLLAQKGRT